MVARRLQLLLAAAVAVSLSVQSFADENGKDEKKAEKPKLKEHKIRDITLKVPETWKNGEIPERLRRMRLKQFVIPKAKGDSEPTILVVSAFRGGGNIIQNLPRWKSEFTGGGLEVKVTEGKSPQGPYVVAELTGTHQGSAFARRKEVLKNATVVTLILMPEGKANYYLKITGPAKSVAPAAKALRAAIGADIKAEKAKEL